ncbi:hypothetical protein PENTCL1PPCAC_20302, partial [Pristionchus entomophagus]
ILAMIVQLISEIKHGMQNASTATKKHQTRAVFSLAMQGAVPNLFYILPACCLLGLHLYPGIVGVESAASNRAASTISILSMNVMGVHSFAHSMTVLGCSPAYRKAIRSFFRKI